MRQESMAGLGAVRRLTVAQEVKDVVDVPGECLVVLRERAATAEQRQIGNGAQDLQPRRLVLVALNHECRLM